MTETQTLDKDAFMRLVTQEHLQVEGPSAGYLYAGRQGKDGWEMFRTANNPWYLFKSTRTNTQNGVGGGALTILVTIPAGVCAILTGLKATGTASAGATLSVSGPCGEWGFAAAGATRILTLPSVGTAANAHGNYANTVRFVLGPGDSFSVASSAALQTEVLTLQVELLLSADTQPTYATTGSAGTPALNANTATTTLVPMPCL